jgi:uncharacterized membrane protein
MATLNNVIANANGNVGIGTTNPTAKLTIVDNTNGGSINLVGRTNDDTAAINFRANGDASTYAYVAPDTNEFRLYHNDGFMSFYPGGSEKVRITSTGNVGIGTTSPTGTYGKLSVAGGIRILDDNNAKLEIGRYSSGASNSYIKLGSNSNSLRIANNADSVDIFTIENGGNVGIGTTSPAFSLDVTGGVGLNTSGTGVSVTIGANNTSDRYLRIRNSNGNFEIGSAGNQHYLYGIGASNFFTIYTNSAERFRIAADGNVGIGTSSPTATLQVGSNSSGTSSGDNSVIARIGGSSAGSRVFNLTLANTATATTSNESALSFIVAGTYSATGIISAVLSNIASAGTDLVFTTYNNALVERMRIRYDGNVGIGTTSPSQKLHVVGTAYSDTDFRAPIFYDSNDPTYYLDPASTTLSLKTRGYINITNASAPQSLAMLNIGYNGSGETRAIDIYGGWGGGENKSITFNHGSTSADIVAQINAQHNGPGSKLRFGKLYHGGNSSTYTMELVSESTTSAYLTVAGSVGIGTTSPTTKLAVSDGTTIAQVNPSSGVAYFGTVNNYPMALSVNSSEKVRILNDGNVGIGTSSPGSKLHVVGAVYGTTSGQFGTAVANGANASFAVFGGNSTSVGVKLVLDSDVNRNDLVVTATSGNIGIGTNSAAYKLDVSTSIVSRSNISTPRFSSAGGYVYGITNSPSWVTSCGSYTNNNATAPDGTTSAGTYTLNSTCASYDLYQTITGITVGRVYTIGMWVKLGTATNFCLVVNNTLAWNSIGGKAFTSSDGLSTGKWTHISFTFTQPAGSNQINIHLGYHAETAVTQQTAGTVFLWNIEMTEFSSTWIGNVEDEIRLPGSSIWTSRGNVGIGTTNPVDKLSIVNGNIGLSDSYKLYNGSAADSAGLYFSSNQVNISGYSGIIFRSSATNISGQTERMRIANDGNVGIGTSSPGTLLQVHGSNPFVRISNSASSDQGIKITYGTSETHGLHLLYNANSALSYIDNTYPIDAAQVWGDILFRQNVASTMTTRMIIKGNSGNIGIGGTPSARLHVFDTNSSPATGNLLVTSTGGNASIRIDSNSTANYTYFTLSQGGVGKIEMGIVPTSSDFYINPTVQSGASGAAIYIKKADGNVGIGTTSPAYKLDVNGPIGISGFRFVDQSTNYFRIFEPAGNIALYLGNAADPANYYDNTTHSFRNRGGSSNYVTINSSGNVGIGTTSPSSKFVVNNNGGVGSAFYVDVGNRNDVTTLFEHTGASTPVPFRLKKSGYSGAAANYGILYLQMNDGTVGNGSNLYFTANDSAGNEHEYGGLGAHIITNTNGAESGDVVFYTSDAGTIRSEKVRIKYNGNVGIGSTAPNDKLDVVGRVYAYRYIAVSSNATSPAYATDTSSGMFNAGSNIIGFSISGVEKVRIDAGGNVGVGITSLVHKIQAAGLISAGDATYNNNSTFIGAILNNDQTNPGLDLRRWNGGGAGTDNHGATYIATNSAGDTLFYNGLIAANTRATNEKMRISVAGNVGIGTTSALGKLHVYGLLRVGGAANEQTGIIALGNDAHPTGTYGDNGMFRGGIGTLGSANYTNISGYQGIVFNVQNAGFGSQATRMIIDVNGNVGIGTTTPTAPLMIYKASDPFIRVNGGGALSYIQLDDGSSNGYLIKNVSAGTSNGALAGALYTYTDSGKAFQHIHSGTPLFTILSGGNVGIGTTGPITKLDVRSGYITAGTGVSTSGTTIIGGYYSDGNLTILGTEYSSGGPMLGYGVTPSTSSAGAFFSSTGVNVYRSAYTQDGGSHRWFTGAVQTVAIGSAVSISEKMRMDTNGNVGIGTTSPGAKLVIIGETQISSNAAYTTHFNYNDVGTNFITTANTGFTYFRGSSNGLTIMTVAGSGNVGIGTGSPSTKLEVGYFLDAFTNKITVSARYEYQPEFNFRLGQSGTNLDWVGGVISCGDDGNYNGIINFKTANSGRDTPTTKMVIRASGNVGIGTTTPTNKLEVVGSIAYVPSVGNPISISNDATYGTSGTGRYVAVGFGGLSNGANKIFAHNMGEDGIYICSATSRNINFRAGGGATDHVVINSVGNVGIGTTSPTQKLDVNGTVLASAFSGPLTGNVTGNATNVSGTVAIANGGTGATSAAAARTNLGIANNYLYAKRTTNQTIASGTWASRDIIFNINSASSGIAYDTSTGVASLTGGKVYRITALLSWSRSSAFSAIWSLFNNADNSQLGPDVYNDSVTYTINEFVNPTLDMILAPTSSIDVKIRTSSNMSVYDSSLYVQGTNVCLIIQQIA